MDVAPELGVHEISLNWVLAAAALGVGEWVCLGNRLPGKTRTDAGWAIYSYQEIATSRIRILQFSPDPRGTAGDLNAVRFGRFEKRALLSFRRHHRAGTHEDHSVARNAISHDRIFRRNISHFLLNLVCRSSRFNHVQPISEIVGGLPRD
jgi:hypothetical protein